MTTRHIESAGHRGSAGLGGSAAVTVDMLRQFPMLANIPPEDLDELTELCEELF